MADDLIPINIWLAGRSYRIRIHPHEEEMVRKAVKSADDKITELRTHYAGKDDQDFVAMCLLTYATDFATGASPSFIQEEIHKLSQKIDKVLNKEE